MIKTCSKCDVEKDLEEFYKRKGGLYDRHSECKQCMCKRTKEWTASHREEKKQTNKKFDLKRREQRREEIREARKKGVKSLNQERLDQFSEQQEKKVKRFCRISVNQAVQEGLIVKPAQCETCYRKEDLLHGHHFDYGKPTLVIWLCTTCHGKITILERRIKEKVLDENRP